MVVTVNGERREIAAEDVASLLDELGYEGRFFAVALNGDLVRRAAWREAAIRDGDAVEVLTPRQGG